MPLRSRFVWIGFGVSRSSASEALRRFRLNNRPRAARLSVRTDHPLCEILAHAYRNRSDRAGCPVQDRCLHLSLVELRPLGAVSLFAGSRLPRRWAWVVPVAAMVISDIMLDHDRSRPLFELTRWTIYATLAATTLLGRLANSPRFGRLLLPVLALGGSVLFFLTSNLATWGEGLLYPMTFSGLALCYAEAIPFFRNTLAADLVGTALLFGLAPLFERAAPITGHGPAWPKSRPRVTGLILPDLPDFAPHLDPNRGQAARQCSLTGRSPGRTGRRGGHYRRQGADERLAGPGDLSTSGARCGTSCPGRYR